MISEPAQKCEKSLSKTILQNYLLHLKWLIIGVLALEEIYIFQIYSKKSFKTSTTGLFRHKTFSILPSRDKDEILQTLMNDHLALCKVGHEQ